MVISTKKTSTSTAQTFPFNSKALMTSASPKLSKTKFYIKFPLSSAKEGALLLLGGIEVRLQGYTAVLKTFKVVFIT